MFIEMSTVLCDSFEVEKIKCFEYFGTVEKISCF